MVWYLVPSRDPKLVVAVGWEPVLGSFVGRVEGVHTGALVDPDRPTVAWFGSRQGELPTVQDLQEAIGEYAALGSDVRAALEADRTGRADQPLSSAAVGPLLLASNRSRPAEAESPDPSTGRALLELALMVGLLVVVLVLMLIAVLSGADL